MKKMRIFTVMLALALIAVLVMAGCSSQAQNGSKGRDFAGPEAAPPAEDQSKGGEQAGDGTTLPIIDMGNAAASGKKIIYTADMSIEAKDAAAAIKSIASRTVELGGYVSGSQYYEDSRNTASWITVRIAPEKLNEFTEFVGSLGKVKSQMVTSQDVTAQYTDLQSWLTNAQAQEAQLLEYMKRTEKIEDLLKVREQLNAVQREIEQYKGQLRLMDNQVGFSTVTVSIQQPPAPAVVVEEEPGPGVQFWGFEAVWQKISRSFVSGFNGTLNAVSWILMALSYIIIPLILIAVVLFVILVILRLTRKKKK